MKKPLLALLITAMFPLSASATLNKNTFYVGGDLGFTDYREKSTLPLTYALVAGYNFTLNSDFSLAVEVEGRELGDGGHWRGWDRTEYTTTAYSASLKPKYHFYVHDRPVYFAASIGAQHIKEKIKLPVYPSGKVGLKDEDTTMVSGLEIGSMLNEHLTMTAAIRYSKADLFNEDRRFLTYTYGIHLNF
ncbi:outer membrane beta-barrel protein [Photobacterium minamisatsumaniensis]|uniref:outer membrane beta-barrel protein n=1 Tax=Photobacterium minamisatsumaniensis TaxID=2910233 RepID=UPI003D09803D